MINHTQLTHDRANKMFTVEASDLKNIYLRGIPNDIIVRGKFSCVTFQHCYIEFDMEGEVDYWEYRISRYDVRKNPNLEDYILRVFND